MGTAAAIAITTDTAAVSAVAAAERCLRCGTKLRNNRPVCPCCGYEAAPAAAPEQPSAAKDPSKSSQRIKKVAAKAGVKICTICLISVPEQDVVDHEGQQVCPECAENLRKKASKRPPMQSP